MFPKVFEVVAIFNPHANYDIIIIMPRPLQMYEGKEMRRQLIEELRTTHALQAPEQKIKKTEAADLKSKQSLQKEHLHKVRIQ